jgi:hypothetical protein
MENILPYFCGLVPFSAFVSYLVYCYSSSRWPEQCPRDEDFMVATIRFNGLGISGAVSAAYFLAPVWLSILVWMFCPVVIVGAFWGLNYGVDSLLAFFETLGQRARDDLDAARHLR